VVCWAVKAVVMDIGGDLRARNAESSWLECAGVMCSVAERMRVSVAVVCVIVIVMRWLRLEWWSVT